MKETSLSRKIVTIIKVSDPQGVQIPPRKLMWHKMLVRVQINIFLPILHSPLSLEDVEVSVLFLQAQVVRNLILPSAFFWETKLSSAFHCCQY